MTEHSDYTVRAARECEASAVADLLLCAVPESVRPLTILGQDGIAEWIAHSIRDTSDSSDRPNAVFLVVAAEESIVGAAEWRRYEQTLFLNSIAVDPAHRQRGLGTELLQRGLTVFDEPAHVALDVFRDNRFVRRWYERIGFQTKAVREWLVCPLDAASDLPGDGIPSAVSRLPSNVYLRNEADANANHKQFGFSTLRFEVQNESESQHHEVGRLGNNYFRITDASTAQTTPIRRALLALDSSRSLLYLQSASSSDSPFPLPPAQTTCRARSLRMRAPLPVVDAALSDSPSPS